MSSNSKSSFFRQSGWMVFATLAGGFFMAAVHPVTTAEGRLTQDEYTIFVTLLKVFLWMGIPSAGLQNVFAQQTASAINEPKLRDLSSATRSVLKAGFILWVLIGIGVFATSGQIISQLKISNPAALWLTFALGLASLWLPIFKGLLQGKQHFTGLGWIQIIDGVGRFLAIVLVVVGFHGQAAGAVLGALLSQVVALVLGAWLTRDIWAGHAGRFYWKPWLKRVIPLTLGLGAITVVSATDLIYVRAIFSDNLIYPSANQIGFATMQFVTPITMVMFPRVVRSVASAEKTDVVKITIYVALAVGGLIALFCTFFPEIPLKVLYFKQPLRLAAAPLVPWFVWALLPLILSTVLITNLMARERFQVVPWVVLIAGAYIAALKLLTPTIKSLPQAQAYEWIVATLGVFGILLTATSAWFTWKPASSAADQAPAQEHSACDTASAQ